MNFSLKNVSKIVVLSSGFALLGMGCVADDEGYSPDSNPTDPGPDLTNPDEFAPPVVVLDPEARVFPLAETLTAGEITPSNLTVTNDSIYWVEFIKGAATIKWMHIDGGTVESVNRLESLPFSSAADENGIYFAAQTDANIVFAPHLGLDPELLHFSKADPLAIALTADSAYWTAVDGCLYRGSKEGGNPQAVSCGTGAPVSLSIADGQAYWSTMEGDLYTSPLAGQLDADKLAEGQDFAGGIVADVAGVYWVDETHREVRRYWHSSETVTTLAEGQFAPAGVAQDRFYLYFTTQGDGGVKRVLKAGGSEVDVMAEQQDEPGQIIATADWVYWISEGDGSISRIDKNFDYQPRHASK